MPAPTANHGALELVPPPGTVFQNTMTPGGMTIVELIYAKGQELQCIAWLEQELIRWKSNLVAGHQAAHGKPAVHVGPWGELSAARPQAIKPPAPPPQGAKALAPPLGAPPAVPAAAPATQVGEDGARPPSGTAPPPCPVCKLIGAHVDGCSNIPAPIETPAVVEAVTPSGALNQAATQAIPPEALCARDDCQQRFDKHVAQQPFPHLSTGCAGFCVVAPTT